MPVIEAAGRERRTFLFDGNLLIALHDDAHVFFSRTNTWVTAHKDDIFATCAITEGTLLRFLMTTRNGILPIATKAWKTLSDFRARPNFIFLDAGFTYMEVSNKGLRGRKEITDAWLATLARKRGCRLATLDNGLAVRHPDVAELIP